MAKEKSVEKDIEQNEEILSSSVEEKKETKMKPADVEKKVIELGKQGIPAEKIGLVLRDKHGIPKAKMLGKKIGQILRENNLYENSEKRNLNKKIETLGKHMEKNKHDFSAKRSLTTSTGRLNRLIRIRKAD
jgi:small subunit ribosomal protein S15